MASRQGSSRIVLCALAALAFAGLQPRAAWSAAAGDDWPTPRLQDGPVAWLQEYWDVKPDKLDQFVEVYRREVYALARKLPGYRGYSVMTTVPDANGFPEAPQPDRVKIFLPHEYVYLEGKTKTERAINVGLLIRQTHNTVIVHQFQTWAAAQKFKDALAQAYADAHGGANYSEHLSQTLYPLANNL